MVASLGERLAFSSLSLVTSARMKAVALFRSFAQVSGERRVISGAGGGGGDRALFFAAKRLKKDRINDVSPRLKGVGEGEDFSKTILFL